MTEQQFRERVLVMGGSEREAELIAALVYPEWALMPATKLTRQQKEDLLTLLHDRREEDREQAYITHEWAKNHEAAGYVVYWERL